MEELTDEDRLDLCDIAWFIKGMKQAGNCPFTNQDETLEKVIKYISRNKPKMVIPDVTTNMLRDGSKV